MGKYFGTDGVRGRFEAAFSISIAKKIALFLGQNPNEKTSKILLGQDPRLSSPLLADALKEGFLERGATVVDLSYTTTPSISYVLSTSNDFDFGVMISASHNPYHDNGIKIFNHQGEKISEELENDIEQFIDHPFNFKKANQGDILDGKIFVNQYIDFLVKEAQFKQKTKKVLIDCANGSVSYLIESLVKKLGIKADLIHHKPNGKNINDHCGATHLESLHQAIKKDHYAIGIAFDGDGDRMMAILPNGQVLDGDAQIFIHALHMKNKQSLKTNRVVATVMSNLGLKTALKKEGIDVVEVPVGDRHVQQGLKHHHLNLGGEQSGHVMFYDLLNTGSGLLSMIQMLNILFLDDGLTLANILQKLIYFPQCLKNVSVQNKASIINHPTLIKRIQLIENSLHQEGRVLVRASGTEPLIRVMVEAKTSQICEDRVDEIIKLIHHIEVQGE